MLFVVVLGLALGTATGATAAATGYDANGTFLLNGPRAFPIVLSDPPPRDGTTPSGGNGLAEIASSGVTFVRVGPNGVPWSDAEITNAQLWDQAVAPLGMYTWIKMRELATAQPGTTSADMLKKVVTALRDDAGLGLWKGADEPWWSGLLPSQLQYAYCMGTSRRSPSWCSPDTPLDSKHVWVTIEAPRGTASDLQPYSAVTDSHGVDIYPVTYGVTNPDLHQVGTWTQTLSSITPNHVVWTTLQICSSGSRATDGSEDYVLPTKKQERYMIYDAIINGARALAFFGGNVTYCWNSTDMRYGWNWTFWNTVLKSLIQEINAISPLAPALLNAGATRTLQSSDTTTQVISREGSTSTDIWVVAARSGSGAQTVTISGLPSTITSGTVYTEGRSVSVNNGSFSDSFAQWDVHVYRFSTTSPAAPTISSFAPTSGSAGTSVTISGTNFTGATAVTFNGTAASSTVNSDTQITATVPSGATSGRISVTTAGGTATSATSFTVTAPTITSFSPGSGRVGTSVTISGTNFTGATAVTFNGTAASSTVNSDTQITAAVPSGATSGPISVTTPGGTATSSKSFKVR